MEAAKAFGVDAVLDRYKYWHLLTAHAVDERRMLLEVGLDFRLGPWMQAFEADQRRTKAAGGRGCGKNHSGKENKLTGSRSDMERLLQKSKKELVEEANLLGVAHSGRKGAVAEKIGKANARHKHRKEMLGAHPGNIGLATPKDGMAVRTAHTYRAMLRKRNANSTKDANALARELVEGADKKKATSQQSKRRRQKRVKERCGRT